MSTEWWAIEYKPGTKGNWTGPTLVKIDGDIIYWDGGPSHMTVHDWSTIRCIKQYENTHTKGTDEWWERVDEIRDQFEKDFPPKTELIVSGGWLAPDGGFYPCRYMEHLSEAYRLSWVHHNSKDGEKELERQGWAKVWNDGQVYHLGIRNFEQDYLYTQAQINTLGALLVLATEKESEQYVKNISKELKYIAKETMRND